MVWGVDNSDPKLNKQLALLPRQNYTVWFHLTTKIARNQTPLFAASLKAWNRRDCHPQQAILDSGASDHFLPMSYKGNCETPTTQGITVTCANGGQLVSTVTDIINFHGLPPAATRCHKFPNEMLVDPLLSLGNTNEKFRQAMSVSAFCEQPRSIQTIVSDQQLGREDVNVEVKN